MVAALARPRGAACAVRSACPRRGFAPALSSIAVELGVATLGRPVQRRHAVALRAVDVGALLQQRVERRPRRRAARRRRLVRRRHARSALRQAEASARRRDRRQTPSRCVAVSAFICVICGLFICVHLRSSAASERRSSASSVALGSSICVYRGPLSAFICGSQRERRRSNRRTARCRRGRSCASPLSITLAIGVPAAAR